MRLPASLRALFYAFAAVLTASGLVWLGVHYAAAPGAPGSALALEVHGGAAMAVLFLVGIVVALHVPHGWRERRNRGSGIAVASLLSLLAITGFLLYYAGGDRLRETASLVHWSIGLAAPVLLWLHTGLGHRATRLRNGGVQGRRQG
jgi:hypothetical protein